MAKDRLATGKYWNASWNFVYGCTPVGEGCKNCWAKALHWQRRGATPYMRDSCPAVYRAPFENVTVFPDRLDMPLHWKKPRVVAVNFSGDTFHAKVADEILDQAFAVMALCRQHTFIVLSKRWERMAEYMLRLASFPSVAEPVLCDAMASLGLPPPSRFVWPFENVQLGVSVSTQAELNAAVPHLLATPAAVKLLSLEPLLEPLCMSHEALSITCESCGGTGEIDDPNHWMHPDNTRDGEGENWCLDCAGDPPKMIAGIDGVFVGCETGPNRRPCPIEHIESVVAQCQAAGVPPFVKQVDLNGRVSHDMAEWPESIRVRELPG